MTAVTKCLILVLAALLTLSAHAETTDAAIVDIVNWADFHHNADPSRDSVIVRKPNPDLTETVFIGQADPSTKCWLQFLVENKPELKEVTAIFGPIATIHQAGNMIVYKDARLKKYMSSTLHAEGPDAEGHFDLAPVQFSEELPTNFVAPLFRAVTEDVMWSNTGFAFSYVTIDKPLNYDIAPSRRPNTLSVDTRIEVDFRPDGTPNAVRGYDLNKNAENPLMSCYF